MALRKLHPMIVFIVAIAMLFSGCGGGTATATSIPVTASLSEVAGTVNAKNPSDADFSAASEGFILNVQGQVSTGEDGRVRLDLSTGTVVRLASNTIFTLISNEPQSGSLLTRIKLEAGRIWIALTGGSIDVETPSGLASVRGSNMMVWVDPATQDVYVSCFEGTCAAENSSGSYGMGIGDGRILYHVGAGETPPPPTYYRLTWQDFEDWAENNPEIQNIFPSIIQTLTAIPPLTTPTFTITPLPTATVTNTPTSTASTCFTLTAPANRTILPAAGEIPFSWTSMPGAAKYEIIFTAPDQSTYKGILTGTTYPFVISRLISGGTYTWKVSAYDASGKLLCTAPEFTFKKDVSPTVTPTPLPLTPTTTGTVFNTGPTNFYNETGPTGTLSSCATGNFYTFSAIITDLDGISGAGLSLHWGGGSTMTYGMYQESADMWYAYDIPLSDFAGQTVSWYFIANDMHGNYAFSPNTFYFTCP